MRKNLARNIISGSMCHNMTKEVTYVFKHHHRRNVYKMQSINNHWSTRISLIFIRQSFSQSLRKLDKKRSGWRSRASLSARELEMQSANRCQQLHGVRPQLMPPSKGRFHSSVGSNPSANTKLIAKETSIRKRQASHSTARFQLTTSEMNAFKIILSTWNKV